MANWYVIRGTKEIGPFQDAQLRQFAATGKLKPEDIVRREDVATGRKASDIKGLFPAPEPELSMDLDTPPPIPDLPQEVPVVVNQPTLMDRAKQSATNMAEYAKKQTKLKSLEFSEIPALLTKIGTTVFAERLHQDVFADLYAEIDGIDAQVAELRIPSPTSATDTVADRMKRTGTAAVNATKAEACLSNRKKQIQRLGEQFEKAQLVDETSPLQPMISKLRELYLHRDQLKGEIAGIDFKTNIVDGSKQFARETLEGARAGTAWWQKPWFLITSMFFCFPVALGIIWTNQTWEKNRKLRWTAGFVCGFICMVIVGQRIERQTKEEIAKAHEQWKSGDREAAAIVYRRYLGSRPKEERSLLYGRVIDLDLENGDEPAARELATTAIQADINPSVTTDEGKSLVESVRQSKQKPVIDEPDKNISIALTPASIKTEEDIYSLSLVGRSQAEVMKLLGKPDYVNNGGRLTNGRSFEESWEYEGMLSHAVTGDSIDVKIFFDGDNEVQSWGTSN